MTSEEDRKVIWEKFRSFLWPQSNLDREKLPLLAHYTSMSTFEKMMKNDEIWFSNPLYMNDIREINLGLDMGINLVMKSKEIENSLKTIDNFYLFSYYFNLYHAEFKEKDLLDIYAFCLSEHKENDNDGKLSMWRGYGGNGNGVAIVFDTNKIEDIKQSPLTYQKIKYVTVDELTNNLNNIIIEFSDFLEKANVPKEMLDIPAKLLFEKIKSFSLWTKHYGFSEEEEWRLIYRKDRDPQHSFENMYDYMISTRGAEPKLKFKVSYIEGATSKDLSFSKMIHKIILGPNTSLPLSQQVVERILKNHNKTDLISKVYESTIPFRSK